MSHGITKDDIGYVGFADTLGHTWHRLPQYIELNGAVPVLKALEVMDFELEKRPNYGMNQDGAMRELEGSFHIVRADTDTVLVGNVGNKFTVVNNGHFFNYVNENILAVFPQLEIESAGTLFGGATTFINLKVNEFYIKGDDSPNVNRLMYYNPLGKGSYGCGAHSVRIVCNNTLTASEAEAKANGSMFKFRHTSGAQNAINNHMMDLSETFLALDRYVDSLDVLAGVDMNASDVSTFLESLYPTDKGSKKSETTNLNKQEKIKDVFETVQDGMTQGISRSAYAMLNAVTWVVDHPETLRKGQDIASNTWDGLVGLKSEFKTQALSKLIAMKA
jgi:phage/plasmid-like protein (TIGR03299 family)